MKLILMILSSILLLCLFLYPRYNLERLTTEENIQDVHNKLKLKHGDFNDELPEQKMILKHITGESKVIEFGPNIGRSSLIINYKLKDKTQHLCIESSKDSCDKLTENRDLNNMKFQIFNGAISNIPLYQQEQAKQSAWIVSPIYNEGSHKVNVDSLNNILEIYNIKFNTIVADCEGCIVSILKENEHILKQIKLIILEHDFNSKQDLILYNNLMKKYNFKLIDKTLKKTVGLENWKEGIKDDPIFVSVWSK